MIETTVSTETLTGISLPPGTIVGYRANGSPIYNIAGGDGRIEVGTDDDDNDDSDDDEQDEDEDEKDEWVPPTKDEFEKVLAAKAKADSEAAARKRFLRDAGFDPKTGKAVSKPKFELDDDSDDDDSDDDTSGRKPEAKSPTQVDTRKVQRDLQRQLEREVVKAEHRERERGLALVSAVPEALEEAGFNTKHLKRALKLIDFDAVEVDSDGEIDGLLEQIDELKNDFPEFFKRTRMREAAKDVADTKTVGGGRKKAPESKADDSWQDRIAQAIQRGGN